MAWCAYYNYILSSIAYSTDEVTTTRHYVLQVHKLMNYKFIKFIIGAREVLHVFLFNELKINKNQ